MLSWSFSGGEGVPSTADPSTPLRLDTSPPLSFALGAEGSISRPGAAIIIWEFLMIVTPPSERTAFDRSHPFAHVGLASPPLGLSSSLRLLICAFLSLPTLSIGVALGSCLLRSQISLATPPLYNHALSIMTCCGVEENRMGVDEISLCS
ncbi:hypothetical protein P175DRAFT_0527615 [Aspergillus ochraceoroseus IBT 24754]|uniref:Uncharacterized protein n=1 Tax=Aspergillus ochraceoroseus IBT 24754 TaxID=1392256 RepID=A0A2T5M6K2_9EURO|nr:uncharacterized protein P175DRAFT_0527615 [Aspergillus ochraceoroseus IBT 24754]PTU24161.1 hypothetical protein P175DRAFT_0527615 [Aspergillus ochraceoroseus IBT 24754]